MSARSIRCLSVAGSLALLALGCAEGRDSAPGGGFVAGVSAGPSEEVFGAGSKVDPATGRPILVDFHQKGAASGLQVEASWGRLVDVHETTAAGERRPVMRDFVVGDGVASDGVDYALGFDALTQRDTLTILHPLGTEAFGAALRRADAATARVLPVKLPPFTMVPRNAALVLRFDDLLDAGSVSAATAWMETGVPASTPFDARILVDPNHGDVFQGAFRPTRVIVDFTVSASEAIGAPLPLNPLGLPPSQTTGTFNALLRLPGRVVAGLQPEVIRNLAGRGLRAKNNGPIDTSVPTRDVLVAFRSGGGGDVTGDPNDGFLDDAVPPRVVGRFPAGVTSVFQPPGFAPDEFRVSVDLAGGCLGRLEPGDGLLSPLHRARVLASGPGGAVVRVVRGDPASFGPGPVQVQVDWDPARGLRPECFVAFTPRAGVPPAREVATHASARLAFSEPVRADSFDAFETWRMFRPGPLPILYRSVVADVLPSADGLELELVPLTPLDHASGAAERYSLLLLAGPDGPRDLAGNPLALALPPTEFRLDPGEPTVVSGSLALPFSTADDDGNGVPEVRGQFLYDLGRGVLRPRRVSRFSAEASPTDPLSTVGAMLPFTGSLQTPLSPLGSRMQAVWRYSDLGFLLRDEATHNLDVEGLAWEPVGGVIADSFGEFEMAFAHGRRLPDEVIAVTLLPQFPATGLVATFAQNEAEPSSVVHPRQDGYQISPLDAFVAASGATLVPWPLNRGAGPATTWTWRDTGSDVVGAPDGVGVDTARARQVFSFVNDTGFYRPDEVPTIGLPLLMDFKTFPDSGAVGLNGFRVAIAINSSARPHFRAYSTGSVDGSGNVHIVQPDQELVASGTIDPVFGQTPPADNVVYTGQADFVVRVSRAHTVWFDTGGASDFAAPVVLPRPQDQPAGTALVLAFRGATTITSPQPGTWSNAERIDAYGNAYVANQLGQLGLPLTETFDVSFLGSDPTWKADLGDLDGARLVQARVSFVADPVSGLVPELDALGLAWTR